MRLAVDLVLAQWIKLWIWLKEFRLTTNSQFKRDIMASSLESIVAEAKSAYELQLLVADKLRKRDTVDPYQAGMSSLSTGIRFSTIFGSVSKSQPFFKNAWIFLMDARKTMESCGSGKEFDPEAAYRRMRIFWGLCGLSGLLGNPGGDDYLRFALNSVRPGFDDEWSVTLARRVSSGVEDLKSVSVVQIVFLGLLALMKMTACDSDIKASVDVENVLSLPILAEYRDCRNTLGVLVVDSSILSSTSASLLAYIAAYDSVINFDSYQKGLVAGLTFAEAWLLAVVRECGDFEAGATRLFNRDDGEM
jgi:hypothetical protein